MNIKAFILDLDGVITDTAEYHYLAWKKLADEEDITFNRKENEKLRGVSRRKSLEILLNGREVSEKRIKEMMDRKNVYYNKYIDNISKDDLLPGAEDLISSIISNDCKVALASASKNARKVINKLEIDKHFNFIADGYSVNKAKPAPDIFLYTAQNINTEPKNCVVIEDAKAGINAAISAGMLAVGIGPENSLGHAHLRYDKVKDVNIKDIFNFDSNI